MQEGQGKTMLSITLSMRNPYPSECEKETFRIFPDLRAAVRKCFWGLVTLTCVVS